MPGRELLPHGVEGMRNTAAYSSQDKTIALDWELWEEGLSIFLLA